MPRDDLAGLNLTTVPKVLIECGNMRNATDASLLVTARFQQQVARVLTAAVVRVPGPGLAAQPGGPAGRRAPTSGPGPARARPRPAGRRATPSAAAALATAAATASEVSRSASTWGSSGAPGRRGVDQVGDRVRGGG